MADLSHWDFAETFDGYDAASLILGIEPRDSHEEQWRINVVVNRMEQHYKNAVVRYKSEVMFDLVRDEIGARKPEIESDSMADLHHAFWLKNEETPFTDWLDSSISTDFNRQQFNRYRIVGWLRGIGLKSVYKFDLRTPAELEEQIERASAKWPWGTHHTAALGHLEAAALQFWKLYDPEDDSTAPTNRQVAEWLQSERGLSQKMAEAMASILRADGLPTGPRK